MDNTEGCSTDTKHKAIEDINNGNIMLIPVRHINGQDYLLLSDVEAMAPTTTAILSNGKMIPFEIDSNTLLELVPKRVCVQDVESIWQIHTPASSSSNETTTTLTQQHVTEILQRTVNLEQQFERLLHQLDHVSFSTEDDTFLGSLVSPATDHRHHHQHQHQHHHYQPRSTEHTTEEGNTEAETAITGVSEVPHRPIDHLAYCNDTGGDHSLAPHTTPRSVSPPPAFSDSSSSISSTSTSSSSSSSNPHHNSLNNVGRRTSNPPITHHSSSITTPSVPSPPGPLRYYHRDQEITTIQSASSLHSSSSSPSSSSPPSSPPPPPLSTPSLPLVRTAMTVTGTTPAHRRLGDETITSTSSTSSSLSPEITLPSSSVSNRIDHTPEQQQQHHAEISVAPPPSYETSIFGTIKVLIQHIRLFEHHIPNRHKSPRWLARRAEWVGYEPQTIEQVAYQLVQLEMALLWTAVTESWIQERETWLTLVASARTERHLAGALVNLERHTLVTDEAWQSVRDDWTSELLEVIVSVGF